MPSSPTDRRRGVPWRKWNRLLHRDLGYLAAGLTLVYAVSGRGAWLTGVGVALPLAFLLPYF